MADYRIDVDVAVQTSQLDDAEKRINALKDKTVDIKFESDTSDILSKLNKSLKNTKAKTNIAVDLDIKTNEANAKVNKLLTDIQKLGKNIDIEVAGGKTLGSLSKDLQTLKVNLNEVVKNGSPKEIDAAFDSLNKTLKETSSATKSVKTDLDFKKVNEDVERLRKNAKATIELWRQSHSAAESMFGRDMDDYLSRIDLANTSGEIRNVNQEFSTMTKQAKLAGVAQMNIWDSISKKAKEYASYLSVASVAYSGMQIFRDMAQNVLEVDTAMTGLYRVTDLTQAQYTQLYSNMISSAQKYGATLTDIINATSDWTRAGFDADTSNKLAEVTTMYQHIADLDYNTASENLLTAYNGFKDSLSGQFGGDVVDTVSYITDVLNELDNKYSVTAAGLGEALQRSASAMQLAGNTFQETAAMTTGMTEVIQDPEKSGQALKILSLRLRGMKGELQEMGEEVDPTVENISKMQGQILNLTHGKVDIFDDGEFKSTYEIMDGIHSAWKDMSDIEQADLLETIAGKYSCRYAQKCA